MSVRSYGAVGDGVTDDSAAFQAAATALAGTGVAECIPAGQYMIHETIVLPSNLTIVGSPGAALVGNLTSGSGSTKATFLAQWRATGVNTTLAAANTPGTSTVSSRLYYAPGQQIAIQSIAHSFQESFYTVESASSSGAGTYTLTLDRPVLLQFASADTISGLGTSIPTNIHLLCNGMKFTGSPIRHVEFAGTRASSIEGCLADTSLGSSNDLWFSFDVGGVGNTFRNMTVDCGQTSNSHGLVFETQEGGQIINSSVSHASVGIQLIDSIQCAVTDSQAHANGAGLDFSGEDPSVGCISSNAVGGSYDGNSSYGVVFGPGSESCSAQSLSASQNGSVGIYFDGTGGPRAANRLVNVTANENVYYGVWILPGSGGTVVNGLSASNNGLAGVTMEDDALLTDISASNSFVPPGAPLTSQVTLYQTGGNALVSGLTVRDTQTAALGIINSRGGTMDVAGAQIAIGPGNYGVFTHGGTVRLSHSDFAPVGDSSGEHGVYTNTSDSNIQIGDSVDLTACALPVGGVGTTTLLQEPGLFRSCATTGTETLSTQQARAEAIQTTQSLQGNVRVNVPAGLPGLKYLAYNNATPNGYTWSVGVVGGTAITIGAGQRAWLQSDGTNMQPVE